MVRIHFTQAVELPHQLIGKRIVSSQEIAKDSPSVMFWMRIIPLLKLD